MPADIISSTTQQFLDIHDITNNFVILKDGTVSVILTVDAMNFGLLAEEEQDAIMYAYAGLLNSLNYPIQILIHSQTKDVTVYLQLLKEQEGDAPTDTMRRRIRQYREFVGNLIHERNVLDKKFYVTIPATALELGILGSSGILPGQNKFDISQIERSVLLEKAQNLLDPKRDHLIAQFARIGLFSRQLSTQEIIQLFYVRYNPEAIEGQQIAESKSYSAPLVQASIQGTIMSDNPTANIPPSPTNVGEGIQAPATPATATPTTPAPAMPGASDPAPATPPPAPNPTAPNPAMPNPTVNQTPEIPASPSPIPPEEAPTPAAPATTDPMPDLPEVSGVSTTAVGPSPTPNPSPSPAAGPGQVVEPSTPTTPPSSGPDVPPTSSPATQPTPPPVSTQPTQPNNPAPPNSQPAESTSPTGSTESTPDESSTQAELDKTVAALGEGAAESAYPSNDPGAQSAGSTPEQPAASPSGDASSQNNQGGSMPPVPEI